MRSSHWTADEAALWARLSAHPFEDAACALDFTARLAREHGWSREQAREAISEYRRYCFLAIVAGHEVTPSVEVDEVWHLHLTYTRDYWQRFCPEVLRAELHHGPTAGGRAMGARYREQYAATLASYQRYFGTPPRAFWPPAGERFGDPLRYRRVDTRALWLLPKPRWPQGLSLPRALAGLLGASIPLAALALPLNPFQWRGPVFLQFYLVLIAAVLIGNAIWRRRVLGGRDGGGTTGLSAYEVAYLAGGPKRVLDAATAELLAKHQASADLEEGRLQLSTSPESLPRPLADYARLLQEPGQLRRAPKELAATQSVESSLIRRGLLLNEAQARELRTQLRRAPLLLLLLGLLKIVIGLLGGHPVGFLVMLIIAVALIAWRAGAGISRRTAAGDQALKALRTDHAHLARAPTNDQLGLAVALGVGAAALAGTAYAAVHAHKPVQSGSWPYDDDTDDDFDTGTSSSGASGDFSDSSSDSGSSDSGGDSGGSGCGGCGGGGGD